MKKLLLVLASTISLSSVAQPTKLPEEQAVVVHFQFGSKNLEGLFKAEDQLEAAILSSRSGEMDGHEIAADGSDVFFYMYGPNADRLFKAIEPVLKSISFMRGAEVTRRYGPPKDGVKTVVTKF